MRIVFLFIACLSLSISGQNIPTAISQVYHEQISFDFTQSTGRVDGKWTQGQSMPFPRYYGGSVMYSRNDTTWLYVLGGDTVGNGTASTVCLRYNVNTNTWQYIAPLPGPMRVNSAAVLGDKIYTMGGFNAPFPSLEIAKFYEYSISSNSWKELPDLPEAVFFHKAFGHQDSIIYIVGGMITTSARNTPIDRIRWFNIIPEEFNDADPLPEPKAAFALGSFNSLFTLTSGLDNPTTFSVKTITGNINFTNPSQISYSFKADYQLQVYGNYAYYHTDNEMYAHGGNSSTTGFNPVNNSYSLNILQNLWETEDPLPYPATAFHAGYVHPDQRGDQILIAVIAGGVTTGSNITGQTWVYRDTISSTGLSEINNMLPSAFSLSQNYPNPFNPVTKIEFKIPEESFVKLEVFNLIGEKAVTLISENLQAGTYSYNFDISLYNLVSGTYFYRLTAGGFSSTKKLLILK